MQGRLPTNILFPMHAFAHQPFETALSVGLCACLVVAGRGQEPPPAPRFRDVDAMAVRLLDAKDPVARGEAALWLAESGQLEHYDAILATAADRAEPARHRGILAVGRLGAPGAESFLGRVLRDAESDAPEAVIAAFALGALRDAVPAPAIDALLVRVQGASKKRSLPVVSALLAGLATHAHPSRVTAMLGLRDDEANRGDTIVLLAQAALAKAGQVPSRARVTKWLEADSVGLRLLALGQWQAEWRPDDRERERMVRIARSDHDPALRAAGLDLLTRLLDPVALDLAERAVASRHAIEAAAGARALVKLAGSARHQELERRAFDPLVPAETRAVVLHTLKNSLSPDGLLACVEIARDARAAPSLRVASAMCLAAADSVFAAAILQDLFAAIDDPVDLLRVTRALHAKHLLALCATRLTTPDSTIPSAALVARLHAIAIVDPVLGTELFLALIKAEHFAGESVGQALAALRTARVAAVEHATLALLPAALIALRP